MSLKHMKKEIKYMGEHKKKAGSIRSYIFRTVGVNKTIIRISAVQL